MLPFYHIPVCQTLKNGMPIALHACKDILTLQTAGLG
jgi:hypothetical protein